MFKEMLIFKKILNVYLETARGHPTGCPRAVTLLSVMFWLSHCCQSCSGCHTVVSHVLAVTLLSVMFLRRERDCDFLLQQHCLKAMLPYFFAADHHNYARYLSWYVRQMKHLPQRAKETYWQVRTSVGIRMGGGPQCQQISSESRHISSEGRVLEV